MESHSRGKGYRHQRQKRKEEENGVCFILKSAASVEAGSSGKMRKRNYTCFTQKGPTHTHTTLHKYYWSSRVTLSLQTNYKQMHHPLQVPPEATKTCGKTYNNGQHQESLMSHFFNQKAFYTCLITPMLSTFPIPQSQLSAKPHKPGFPDSLLPALPSLH